MDEGNGRAPGAGARLLVDRGGAGVDHRLQGGGAVVDSVANMVQAFALAGQELGDGGVVVGGSGELDVGISHLDQGLFHAVGLDDLTVVDLGPERSGVVVDGRLQIVDGDGDVVDLSQQHAGESTGTSAPGFSRRFYPVCVRVRALLVAVGSLVFVLSACGDNDDGDAASDETPTSSSTSTASTTTTTDASQAEVRMTVTVPSDLADDFAPMSADQFSWVSQVHRMESESSVGFLGVGASPEPATVSDPSTSVTGNQALAAARGVAGDLLGDVGEGEVHVNEETTLSSGRPAWHIRLVVTGSDTTTEVDLVGLEDAGSFHYAVALSQGLPADTVAKLHDAVAAASMA